MHAVCLHEQAHISAKLGWIREIKVSMESGEHAHNLTPARKLVCMHPKCLRAQAHISAILGRITESKVYIESGKHAGPFGAQNLTRAHKLMCMHTMCLCAWAIYQQIGLDQKDEGIYEIRRTYQTYLSS